MNDLMCFIKKLRKFCKENEELFDDLQIDVNWNITSDVVHIDVRMFDYVEVEDLSNE